jgi:hypothetical protein
MEHVVEVGALRQLKLVQDIADALENLERALELRTQFPAVGDIQ